MGGSTCPDADTPASSHREAHPSARFVPEPGSRAPRTFNPIISIMRLHLPKTLLAAVLAACAALPTWAETQYGWITADPVGNSGPAKSVDGGEMTKITYTAVSDTPSGSITVTTDGASYTLGANSLSSFTATGKDVKFTGPTNENQFLRGTTQSTANSVWLTGGRYENGTDKLENLNGITNVYITGAQIYAQSNSNKTLTSNYFLGAGTNNGTLRLDGNGTVTFSGQTTLVGNATIHKEGGSKGNAQAIFNHLNLNGCTLTANAGKDLVIKDVTGSGALALTGGDANDASTIQIAGSNNIGTLTLNGASSTGFTLVGTSADTTTITSLVTSGSVLDASGMEGTLTIIGAKWSGNLTEASVEVLKARDADTAASFANSMNTTRGISYSFSATGTSVYRVLRTDSLTSLTAKLQGTSGSRIVVDATYGEKSFTNVGLNELLAGDKVTINGLIGWIGDNSSNSILANLVFEGVNSINNGSSGGTINYSGTITGTGTLSFDWSGGTNTYVFTGDLSGFTGKIKDDATLNVTIGGTLAEGVSNAVNATIDIAGILTVNRETTFTKGFTAKQLNGNQRIYLEGDQTITCTQDGNYSANIDVKSGKLTVDGSVKTSGQLDMKKQDNYTGYVEVAREGVLTVGGSIWGLAATSKILLQEEGSLKWNGFTITGKTAQTGVDTGLKFGTNDYLQEGVSSHTVTNSVITYTGTGSKTLGWTLTDTDLVVQSGRLSLGKDVSAATVTVKSGATLELLTGYTQNVTANTWAWEKGSTLSYGRSGTADNNDKDVVDLGVSVGTVSGTTIELHGVLGTLKAVSSSIKRDIKLTNTSKAAGEFTTIEGDSYTFDGKVKGDGNFALAQASKTTSLIFNGDLSEWTSGSDDYAGLRAVSGTVNATISGTPTNKVVSNAFNKDAGGTLNLTIARDAVLTNKVNITSLAVNAGKTLELRNDTNAVAVGSTTVGAGSKLILDNKRTAEDGTTTCGSVNLGTVSGSGTISSNMEAQSISLSTDVAKTFSGTLEATSGKLTVTGMSIADGYHLMTALKASGGDLDLLNTPLVSITEMVIGENATVGVYSGTTASEENEGGIYVHGVGDSTKGALTVESGAMLKSDLQLVNTVLTFNGSLTMGSDLTLYSGNELAGSLYTSWDGQSALTLFTGVDKLTIGTDEAVADKEYKASTVFSNIGDGYSLKMLSGTDGDYIVQLVQSTPTPEPTTATLSLLALMGLAARRRRRKA